MTAPENIGLLLSLASGQGVATANAALAPLDLNSRSYSLLELLATTDGVSQRELADALRLDPSQIVALVDGLERRTLAERRPHPSDRRQKSVVITGPGRDLYAQARERVEGSIDQLLGDLDDAERQTLRRLLQRIVSPASAEAARLGRAS
ncbi:MarR family winged helix-turn-helix transcriptional regulator [Georgenia ruanii]|uniref:MarR family transcriptional regulator n=1 Tax=Georgenia ruanii TaxID=348442 RepID=A0A7J9UU80_9MICO|nr:MarR family transcriptional regulator [Georgenia ruanii]MPV88167.1 MarR family transcriptional regulator [Georgenia ruanii]